MNVVDLPSTTKDTTNLAVLKLEQEPETEDCVNWVKVGISNLKMSFTFTKENTICIH